MENANNSAHLINTLTQKLLNVSNATAAVYLAEVPMQKIAWTAMLLVAIATEKDIMSVNNAKQEKEIKLNF